MPSVCKQHAVHSLRQRPISSCNAGQLRGDTAVGDTVVDLDLWLVQICGWSSSVDVPDQWLVHLCGCSRSVVVPDLWMVQFGGCSSFVDVPALWMFQISGWSRPVPSGVSDKQHAVHSLHYPPTSSPDAGRSTVDWVRQETLRKRHDQNLQTETGSHVLKLLSGC